ncbi:hypothetical protein [Neptunicella sp. SCSIO 80796]|uniref:hypothetical protein n=1 Tax=Neptunicella plasticusilytica TaxID=3117012 RepID=UPI003A4D4754
MATIAGLVSGLSPLDVVKINVNPISSAWTPEAKRTLVKGPTYTNPKGILENWSTNTFIPSLEIMPHTGGGHFGYAGNEMPYFAFSDLDWHLGYLPTEMTDDAVNSILHPVYTVNTTPENLPFKATHTYCNVHYLPDLDRIYVGTGSDWYGPSFDQGYRYEYIDDAFQPSGALITTGPWLVDHNKFDSTKTGGETGTGVDPTDIGAELFDNRDFVARGLDNVNGRRSVAYGNKVWLFDNNNYNIIEQSFGVTRLTDTTTVYATNNSQLGNISQLLYIPHLHILVALLHNLDHLYFYDLTANVGSFQTIEIDTSVAGWPASVGFGATYDYDRKVIVMWEGESDIWELSVPDNLFPASFALRKLTLNQTVTGDNTNGVQGRWHYVGSGALCGVNDGELGNVWFARVAADTPHPPVKSKSDITPSSLLKSLSVTPLAIIPILSSAGTTVYDFVSESDLTINGSLTTHNGIPVLDGGLTLPVDIGDLSATGITIVFGVFKTPNDGGSQFVKSYILESADQSTFQQGVNPYDGKYYGNLVNTRPWFSDAATEFASVVIANDGAGNTIVCSNGDIRTRSETPGLNIGNNPLIGDSTDKLAYIMIFEGAVSAEEAVQLSISPYDTIFEANSVDTRDGIFDINAAISAIFSGNKIANGNLDVAAQSTASFTGQKVAVGTYSVNLSASVSLDGTKISQAAWPINATVNTGLNGVKTAFGSMPIDAAATVNWLGSSLDIRLGSFNVSVAASVNFAGSKAAAGALPITAQTSNEFSGQKIALGTITPAATANVNFTGVKTAEGYWPVVNSIAVSWVGINGATPIHKNIIQLQAVHPGPVILKGVA